MQGVWFRNS